MIEKEHLLAAQEAIMEKVCEICHWPFAYRCEEVMWAEKCEFCPAAAAVEAGLKTISGEGEWKDGTTG